jgi:hypothetical protein
MPILATGGRLQAWIGRPVDELYVLVYDADTAGWQRIPSQVDERITRSLATCLKDPGLGNVDNHLSYVFSGVESNGLGQDDEVVLRTSDLA